jgi:hypothetical protein
MNIPTMRTLESRDFAIGILSTTAVILLVGLLIIGTRPNPVWADGMTTTGGDYVLTVGSAGIADEEYVYVLDTPSEKLIVYRFNAHRQQIEIAQGLDLAELRGQAEDTSQPPRRSRGSGARGRRP